MPTEHHDLIHELPEHRERIHVLKTTNNHFAKLFDEYHDVTKQVEKMVGLAEPVCTQTEEALKLKRLHLKDQLFTMVKQA